MLLLMMLLVLLMMMMAGKVGRSVVNVTNKFRTSVGTYSNSK